jgi:hypothetical protein
MQLVWFFKVLKGPHVSGLGLQQKVPQGHKCGSVLWLVCPALDHDIVDILRTVFRAGQALPFLVNLMQDLTAIEANPGLLAIGEHLPQCDPKHPGVAGMGESPCLQALRGTPGKRHLAMLLHDIVVIILG